MPGRVEIEFKGTERFEIKRRLGAGGMGVVYEAFDRERNVPVALKTMRHMSADALLRFKNEFRALQDIEHPNLVSLDELAEESGTLFFTMELVTGVDFVTYCRKAEALSSVVQGSDTLPTAATVTPSGAYPHIAVASEASATDETSAREISATDETLAGSSASKHDVSPAVASRGKESAVADPPSPSIKAGQLQVGPALFDEVKLRPALAQLASAVAKLHAVQKVHRDIKPANILVNSDGRVVLLDFGLIAEMDSSTRASNEDMVGTVAYMAPEQATSKAVGPEADWYSLGVVLYQVLTGRLPFTGTPMQVLMDKQRFEPIPSRARVLDVPPDLDALCVDLLRTDPRMRPTLREILKRVGIDATLTGDRISTTSQLSQTFPFVGRESELAVLQEAFRDTRKGRAVALYIRGDSGVGKSELVRRFTSVLTETHRDLVTLAGRCYERESVPYKAFDGLIDSLSRYMTRLPKEQAAALLPRRASLLPQLFPVLRQVEIIATAPVEPDSILDPQERRSQMFGALRELLLRLARRHPVVLVIDDFQWADADSVKLLEELLHPPEEPPLLLLVTARFAEAEDTEIDLVARARALQGDVRHLRVRPLGPERAQQLVRLLAPDLFVGENDDAAAIAREAGGHPLFIQELVRHVQEQGTTTDATRLDEALWTRVCQLEGQARKLIEILAVSGAPIAREIAANAAELEYGDHHKAASLLRVACFARSRGARRTDTIEPYHDRVREAVLAHLDAATRKHHHGRLAIALEQAGAAESDPQALVRHFAAAGDERRAAGHAEVAALRATRMVAFDQAAEFYQTALRLGDSSEDKTRTLRLALAEAFVNAGRGPEAAETFVLASDGAEPAIRRDCQRQAAEQWLITGHLDQGLDMIGTALAEIGEPLLATPKRALAAVVWRRLRLKLRGLAWKARPESDIPRSERAHLEVLGSTSFGLSMVDNIRGVAFNARFLRMALEVGDPIQVTRALAAEAGLVAAQGGHKRARNLADRVEQIARDYPDDPYFAGYAAGVRGTTHYFASRFRAAEAALTAAEHEFCQVGGTTWERNTANTFRMFCLRYLGLIRELGVFVDTLCRDAQRRGDRYLETTVRRYGRGFFFLARDRPDEARADLHRSGWPTPETAYHLQDWYELAARCEIALYAGQATHALEQTRQSFAGLARSMLLRIQTVRCEARSLQARLLIAASPDPPRLRPVARIARQLEKERVGYATVLADLLWAAVASRRGAQEAAAEHLRKAMAVAEENEMALHLEVARRRLGQLLGGSKGDTLITEADGWMTEQGINNPARMTDTIAPGLPEK